MERCVVLFSGGLDSRLVAKILQERYEVVLVYFRLPFGCGSFLKEVEKFAEKNKFNLEIFDCTKGRLLKGYLEVLKNGDHGRGKGFNPCVDCKIFMFEKAREFADKNGIRFVASGEVLDQRPMSQKKNQIEIIEDKSGLKGRILRPLIDRGLQGRQRKTQIALAKEFGIDFPSPAGGCLLCEKALKKRFEFLINRGLKKSELKLVNLGRHFVFGKTWIVLGRNEKENEIIENFEGAIVYKTPAPSALIVGKKNKSLEKRVGELIRAYSKKGSLDERKKFEKYKI